MQKSTKKIQEIHEFLSHTDWVYIIFVKNPSILFKTHRILLKTHCILFKKKSIYVLILEYLRLWKII